MRHLRNRFRLRMSCKAVPAFAVLVWFCVAPPIHADAPIVKKNPDGGTITTEKVSFYKIFEGPFNGDGEKRTTRDKDGNITKVEWVRFTKKGERPARVVFVERNPNTKRTTVSTYTYRKNGTLSSKTEATYSTEDGALLHQRVESYGPNGKDILGGIIYGYDGWEDGKRDNWKNHVWDPKKVEWTDHSLGADPTRYPKLGPTLDDLQTKWGSKLQAFPSATSTPSDGEPGNTISSLILRNKLAVEIAGTGQTIGPVANCLIQNQTAQPVSFMIPPMVLESSSGKNQHYACPSEQPMVLGPKQSFTVPIEGVCLDRSKPPVGNGVTGDLVINEGNPQLQMPGSHLPAQDANTMLTLASSKYDAADELQKEGKLKDMPYRDKQKQKDIVIQWSVWGDPEICGITGAKPATKDELKQVVYKQVEKQGPMSRATKKKVDQGIDTIFEKVELTSSKAKELEEPEEEEMIAGNSVNISNDTPTPGPQTQEKKKKKDKKDKKKKGYVYRFDWWDEFVKEYPFADWLQKKFKAGWADDAKADANDDYNKKFQDFLSGKKSYNDLKTQRDDAEKKAKAAGATDADKDAFNKLDNELKKLENNFKQDFNKTDDGKQAMTDLYKAEKAADEAHATERDASKNIDQATKDAVDDYLKSNPPPPELVHPPDPVEALR